MQEGSGTLVTVRADQRPTEAPLERPVEVERDDGKAIRLKRLWMLGAIRTDGIIDTGCIATRGDAVAFADRKGNLYVSADTGHSWSRRASGVPPPSSVPIV